MTTETPFPSTSRPFHNRIYLLAKEAAGSQGTDPLGREVNLEAHLEDIALLSRFAVGVLLGNGKSVRTLMSAWM